MRKPAPTWLWTCSAFIVALALTLWSAILGDTYNNGIVQFIAGLMFGAAVMFAFIVLTGVQKMITNRSLN